MMTKQHLIGLNTLLITQWHRIFRLWMQTLIPPIITVTLYYLIFGQLIGQRIGMMGGVSYIQYIAPGLIMMAVINNAFGHVVAVVFTLRFQRSIDEILVSPIPNYLVLIGFLIGGVVRSFMNGLLILIISCFFTKISVQHVMFAIFVTMLAGIIFSELAFINAVFAKRFDDIAFIPTFILTPLIYLGGVFYSITLLPHFWQKVSHLNPILYLIEAFRYSFLGISDISPWRSFLTASICAILLYLVCIMLMRKGVGLRS